MRVASAVRCEELVDLALGDAYWDPIVSIEPDGVEEVFDIEVEGLHNFVADNIVVHNSIEQDADLVAFLYREDYYRDPDEEPDGLAEVIVAKHRNGPIGSPKLVFLDRFPKFADYSGHEPPVEQPAGEGPPLEDTAAAGPEFLMAARPRSEPFAERACPLGACDGSGWILGPEDVARPCECREERLKRGRVRGVASAIPPRYRGVSFDRPPVSDMARSAETRAAVAKVRDVRRAARREAPRGPGPVAVRGHGNRQDDARDAGLQGGLESRRTRSRSTRCRSCSPGSDEPTTRSPAETPTAPSSSASPRSICSTSTTSAQRNAPTGCSSSSTPSSTSATKTNARSC